MIGSTRGIARALRATCRSMILAVGAAGVAAQTLVPDIAVTRVVNAPVADVWKAWTTVEGIESFFAPKAAKVEPLPGNRTELTLRNFGYGDGEEWAKSRAYFTRAWPAVMASLEQRFAPK